MVTDRRYGLFVEVERAAKLVRDIALGNRIVDAETIEDSIVYSGTSHHEFVRYDFCRIVERLICKRHNLQADAVKGRRVTDVGRYGAWSLTSEAHVQGVMRRR